MKPSFGKKNQLTHGTQPIYIFFYNEFSQYFMTQNINKLKLIEACRCQTTIKDNYKYVTFTSCFLLDK